MVDPSSESFYIARRYMLRLNQADFDDPHELAKYAATCGISLDEFRKQFYYLMDNDLLYKNLKEGKIKLASIENGIPSKSPVELKFSEAKGRKQYAALNCLSIRRDR